MSGRFFERVILGAAFLALTGCQGFEARSHGANPLGWPAKGLAAVGWAGADSGIPIIRETGRLLQSLADLTEFPALGVEGLLTADPSKLHHAGTQLLVGTGSTVTASLNLPFFFATGRNIDLAQDVDAVNSALEFLESLPPETWQYEKGDPRPHVFPPGTRARASGNNLIWTVPGEGEFIQAGEESPLFRLGQAVSGDFVAQERSWGMVVGNAYTWYDRGPRQRTITILHEFYHQRSQLRRWFRGWTIFYWPTYGYSFARHGWWGHWAEVKGPHAAYVVNHGLKKWEPPEDY